MGERRDDRADRQTSRTSSEDPAYYEALGRAIKVLRTEQGVERKELAVRAGVSYPYLTEIENGKKRPSSRALLQIAEALGILPYELLQNAERWVPRETPVEQAAMMSPPPPPPAQRAVPASPAPQTSSPVPPGAAQRRGWFNRVRLDRQAAPAASGAARDRLAREETGPGVRGAEVEPARYRGAPGARDDPGAEEPIDELMALASRLPPDDLETLIRLARRLGT